MSSTNKLAAEKNQRILLELANQPGNGTTILTSLLARRIDLVLVAIRRVRRLQGTSTTMDVIQPRHIHLVRWFHPGFPRLLKVRAQCKLC